MIRKKGAIELSVSAIIIIILAIAVLFLGIGFIKGMFGKTQVKLEELILKEPDPQPPTASSPITLSRESIKTEPGNTEIVKVSVFNPTNKDWTFRDAIPDDDARLCGISGDNVCYVNTESENSNCNTHENAITNDSDCIKLDNLHKDDPDAKVGVLYYEECDDEGGIITNPPEGICFIDNLNYCFKGSDPDCAPTEGVRLEIECSRELALKTQTNPRNILSGSSTTFTALLEIKKGIPKKTYLCSISVVGEGVEGIKKDLIVPIS